MLDFPRWKVISILGFLACLMAVERVARIPVLDQFVQLFISFFRGTPLLVQLFLFYYGLPQILPVLAGINGVTAAIIGLSSRPRNG